MATIAKPEKTGTKVDTKFKSGAEWNGNANGRPKGSLSIVEAIKRELEKKPEGANGKTYLELLIQRIFKSAIQQGDVQMIKDIISRIDGLPKGSAPVIEAEAINFNVRFTDNIKQIEQIKEVTDGDN